MNLKLTLKALVDFFLQVDGSYTAAKWQLRLICIDVGSFAFPQFKLREYHSRQARTIKVTSLAKVRLSYGFRFSTFVYTACVLYLL